MLHYDKQTYQDLEFDFLQEIMSEFCVGPTSLHRIQNLVPDQNHVNLEKTLNKLEEFTSIRREGEKFPAIDFEELPLEIRMLPVKNASLQQESFVRILRASLLTNSILYFFNKRESEFPFLVELLENVHFTKEIIEAIEKVFDKRGEIKDDASPELFEIRQQLKSVKQAINKNFDKEVRRLLKDGMLSDMKEAFLNDKRVLSVNSTHKRQIQGNVLGASKTGGLTYIEPQVNIPLNSELDMLHDDERKEIYRILQALTSEISIHIDLIIGYQNLLVEFDFIQAKSRLALQLDATLPGIMGEMYIELIDAYHPVLKLKNKEQGKATIPQSLTMDKFSRMLVISGPNAGGKSITLKTVGLLQLMLQCGLLVPVNSNSKMCFFENLLTDIGDNQSIENELSTYSYRLKRMKHFIEVANKRTLLLLDEFGTGSDPDLGGALAEVFFETLYSKKCFGVITTHYANIKLKADKLRNAMNGCMLFDTETLAPLYRLSLGQPGSSFTFEVAQINGIPMEIIDEAKTRLDKKKVEMDQLLSELQKEKSYLRKLNEEHIKAQELAQTARENFLSSKEKLDRKTDAQQELLEKNNKYIQLGKKFQQYIDKYRTSGKAKNLNKDVLGEVKKTLAVEKSKIEDAKKEILLKKQISKKKDAPQKPINPKKDKHQRHKITIGSTVKLITTKQSGTVEEISGKAATVAFGFMRMKVEIEKLMWIK